jgi:hypothetical protein
LKSLTSITLYTATQLEKKIEQDSKKVMEETAVDVRTATVEHESLDVENFKLLLKNNFLAPILKNGSDFAKVWDAIDTSKLIETTVNLFHL